MDIRCPNCNSIDVFAWNDYYTCEKCDYGFYLDEIDDFSSELDDWYELEDAE